MSRLTLTHRISVARGLASLLGTLAACESASIDSTTAPEVDVTTQTVIDGERERGFDAVVAVVESMPETGSGSLCSGTVIGPYQVLTAKHCVVDEQGKPHPASAFVVAVGDDLTTRSGVSELIGVSEVRTTPGADLEASVSRGDDIAILLLSRRISVAPIAISTTVPEIGSEVAIVGFGRTMPGVSSASDSGIKYRGAMEVIDVDPRLLQTDGSSAACEGDSGGPVLDENSEVIGIVSFGLDTGCYGSVLISTRVSRHKVLIETALPWTPQCPAPMREVCNGSDDNCDGAIDEGCLELGEPCSDNAECKGAACATIDGADICTSLCNPAAGLTGCAPGSYCREFGCGQGVCVLGTLANAETGSACALDTDCAQGHCGSAGGTHMCGRPCRPGRSSGCPLGQVCDNSDGSGEPGCDMGICIPVERSKLQRPLGSACDSGSQCESGDCLGAGSQNAFCTRACNASMGCGSGFHCREARCVAGMPGTIGASCVNAADCSPMAAACVEHGGDHVCGPKCDGRSCPQGFQCTNMRDGSSRCLRAGAALGSECSRNAECSTAVCDDGRCARACSPSLPCPDGLACSADGEAGATLCRPRAREDGGCGVLAGRPTRPSPLALAPLLGLCLLRITRRRRKRAMLDVSSARDVDRALSPLRGRRRTPARSRRCTRT
jgi:hypothetical protein